MRTEHHKTRMRYLYPPDFRTTGTKKRTTERDTKTI